MTVQKMAQQRVTPPDFGGTQAQTTGSRAAAERSSPDGAPPPLLDGMPLDGYPLIRSLLRELKEMESAAQENPDGSGGRPAPALARVPLRGEKRGGERIRTAEWRFCRPLP